MTSLPDRIAIDAPPGVRAALAALGRTEDVQFSPSGRRLALASFANERIAVAEVEITGVGVAVSRLQEFTSPALREPHGLAFLDEETLVVACRATGVAVFRAPAGGPAALEPLGEVAQSGADGCGSVVVDAHDPRHTSVLVCNHWVGTITRHRLEGDTIGPGTVIARKWVGLPDGLALSKEGRWLAISNHNSHSVL